MLELGESLLIAPAPIKLLNFDHMMSRGQEAFFKVLSRTGMWNDNSKWFGVCLPGESRVMALAVLL